MNPVSESVEKSAMKKSEIGKNHFRNVPRQKRSQITSKIIVEAASILFQKYGYEKTTTIMIAEKAGISVGTLYQYFKNKESISTYILEHICEDILETNAKKHNISHSNDIDSAVDERMDLLLERLQFTLSLYRILTDHLQDENKKQHHRDFQLRLAKVLASNFGENSSFKFSDVFSSAFLITGLGYGVIRTLDEHRENVDQKAVLSEFGRMLKLYLKSYRNGENTG